jgi:20S proteasome alpha/beta subunit
MSFLYKDGVMIAADRQVSGGTKIIRTNFPKISRASSCSALSFCGSVNMAQIVSRVYTNLLSTIKFRIDEEVPIPGQIKIFEEMMQQLALLFEDSNIGTMFHFSGIDRSTGRAYLLEFYEDGAIVKPDAPYITEGSGGTEARTTLKNFFAVKNFRDLELKEASKLAINAIRVSAEADSGVGDPRLQSSTLAFIDVKDGLTFISQEKIKLLIAEVCK